MPSNEIIGATSDTGYVPGQRYNVSARRSRHEPYHDVSILVVRHATYDEYVAYHIAEQADYELDMPGQQYFAFLVD